MPSPHRKAVPGRQTAVKDSEWLAEPLRHGLLQARFIPPQPIRELRALPRSRKTLVQERAQEVTRLHQVLERANLKLGAVATDMLGTSGRDRLAAILAGEADPPGLAALARGRLRAKLPALRQALEGRGQAQHRVLIRQVLAQIDFLEQQLAALTTGIEEVLAPFAEAVALLETIPGVAEAAATAIVAEIGTDMSRFPAAKHLASWAGLCPGNRQRGGKRWSGKRWSGKTTSGTAWWRAVLGAVAWSIPHTSGNSLVALYHRIARRRGQQKAIVAVAHRVVVSISHMLRDQRPSQELGPDYFDRLDTGRIQRHSIRRLEQLGSAVTLTPAGVS